MASIFITIALIALWYGSNIAVLLSNKFLLSNHGFGEPVFLTLCHMIACVIWGAAVAASGYMPLRKLSSTKQTLKIAALALIFCSTIVAGNASLKYLPVSFNQAIGATTPFFTAILALLLQGSRESNLAYAALIPVMGGVIIGSHGEPLFHLLGFLLSMGATAGRALKSVVQAILMSDSNEKLDPMSLLVYMSLFCVLFLTPLTFYMEPTSLNKAGHLYFLNRQFATWMVVNASLAYAANLLNFLVTKHTSALTLQVLGNAKGVVASVISVLVFWNPVNLQSVSGYALTVSGVLLYSEAKRRARMAQGMPGGMKEVYDPTFEQDVAVGMGGEGGTHSEQAKSRGKN